jgi:hypothetical protein
MLCVAACADSSSSTTTTTSVCSQATALKQSVQDLEDVDVAKNGTSALSDAVTAVKTDLSALAKSASSALKPAVDALQTALDQLGTAISNFSADGMSPVLTAASATTDAANALVQDLDDLKC